MSVATSGLITGLTPNTTYKVRVAAVNQNGQGPWSTVASGIPALASDPYFTNVSLLLHADGTGSTFVDSSLTPKTITASGNVTQSTAQSKFGGKSAAFDGNGDYLTVPQNDAFSFGTGDFVVEFWMYLNASLSSGTPRGCAIFHSTSLNGFCVGFQTDSILGLLRQGVAWESTISYSPPANQWIHIAVSRSSGNVRWYINGTQSGSTSSNSQNYSQGSSSTIGGNLFYNVDYLDGYIDDLRITKGVARYTANFTPPTAAFPDA